MWIRYFFRGFELQTYCQCLCLCRFCNYALQSKNQSLLLFDTAAPLLQGCETLVVNSHQKCLIIDLVGIGELNAYNLQSFKSKMCVCGRRVAWLLDASCMMISALWVLCVALHAHSDSVSIACGRLWLGSRLQAWHRSHPRTYAYQYYMHL